MCEVVDSNLKCMIGVEKWHVKCLSRQKQNVKVCLLEARNGAFHLMFKHVADVGRTRKCMNRVCISVL